VGSREAKSGKGLWQHLQDKAIGAVMTDYWQSHEKFLPPELHVQSKAETYTVEGYHSLFRHFLAWLGGKSKCYSKCKTTLRYSLMLLMATWNGTLTILN
jgi:insertion element IS1 protein InsB